MSAQWWVRYRDPDAPHRGLQLLSLSIPDLRDARAATRRAARTARERLKRKGVKRPLIQSIQCVG